MFRFVGMFLDLIRVINVCGCEGRVLCILSNVGVWATRKSARGWNVLVLGG